MNLSTSAVDLMLNALGADLANGYAKVYGHIPGASAAGAQPASGDVAITTQTLAVTHRFGAPGFAGAAALQMLANAIAWAAVGGTTVVARFIRLLNVDGVTVRGDLSIGKGVPTNQNYKGPVSSGPAAAGALFVPVAALQAPVYQGDRLIVGGNKVVNVSADGAINDVQVACTALADAIPGGATLAYDLIWNESTLLANAPNAIMSLALSLPQGW